MSFFDFLNKWIVSLDRNVLSALTTLLSGSFALFVAYFGVKAAFKQLQRQFEHKIIYEGWFDFQKKLFEFASALGDYDSDVLNLNYFLTSQDNPLVNKGNIQQHRTERWSQITNSYQTMQKAYVDYLRSFESHEVIFSGLQKMKSLFCAEMREKLMDNQMAFFADIFPEMYGAKQKKSIQELKKIVNKHWMAATEVGAYLDDFRIELQNETIGMVINKKAPRRKPPNNGIRILTRKGFITS